MQLRDVDAVHFISEYVGLEGKTTRPFSEVTCAVGKLLSRLQFLTACPQTARLHDLEPHHSWHQNGTGSSRQS